MRIISLDLSQFRNLKTQRVEFPTQLTYIVGANGQGKTSVLEAIYLLSQGRSFRTNKTREVVAWTRDQAAPYDAAVTALVQSRDGEKLVGFQLKNGKRKIFINENPVNKATEFFGQFNAMEFTPDDLQLVKGAPALRRGFIDRVLAMVDSSYVSSLVQYQRALKSRNAILLANSKTKRAAGSITASTLSEELGVWSELLIAHGIEVCKRRRTLVAELSERFSSKYQQLLQALTPDKREGVRLNFTSEFLVGTTALTTALLRDKFVESYDRDLRLRKTTFGVHHDELVLEINCGSGFKIAKGSASQGQARSLALALKLAATEYLTEAVGEAPVVLLDDVESELDPGRREALFRTISALNCQVIITGTESTNSLKNSPDKASIIRISDGVSVTEN